MKVTIINNDKLTLVLKPETQLEILAVKGLSAKTLITKHHETTQILDESFPDSLVIHECATQQGIKPIISWMGVYNENNKVCLGVIPSDRSDNAVLEFISLRLKATSVTFKDEGEILDDEPFTIIGMLNGKTLEATYYVQELEFFTE
jgi:hypothetical protein